MKTLQQPQVWPKLYETILIKEEIKKYLHKMPRHNIEIVFWGSDPWSVYVLKALEDNFDVKAIVTASDSSVANYFKGPILTPEKLDHDFLTSHFSFLTSDLFIVASYGKIIPQSILNIPKFASLNVHPSLLPKYRGSSPVPATILMGDKITGVTIIKMDAKVDHGPIVSTKEISLTGQENSLFLINKLFQLGADLLVKIIPDYMTGKIKLMPQNHLKATYCERLTRNSGYFKIDNPPSPEKLDRMIRAYYPWPGVWTRFRPSGSSGQAKIVKFLPGGLLQMEGKKAISYQDFLNGYPDFPIKELLKV
ncbi:methionyl-tRNA formyltransferase [Candidatus Microgenomates bacterium]|nr:methionyl-tRNA formyltransferase [Candidatus Microgenomates bacterium]